MSSKKLLKPLPKLTVAPTTIASECLCFGLKRAARAVARRYDDAFRPFDLNNGQFSMLNAIAAMQPVGMQALADQLAMDRTTVTAALKPLQRRELVQVDIAAGDPRGREIRLMRGGTALFAEATPVWRRLQEEVGAELSASGATQLRRQLSHFG